ncbi:MAG TPA: hypothetical protein VKV04_14265, partial [Verrucomicrobiae bacterium]|nr:hypothetical protein [Verrucomicrobiae bacterium]
MTKLRFCIAGMQWLCRTTSALGVVLGKAISTLVIFILSIACLSAQSKHGASSRYPSYNGLVMCGYQGWFRAPKDGANEGWGHYAVAGRFDTANVHLDFWPDVSEYEKTYSTVLTNRDGTPAKVFSSWDESTTDLH